LCESVCIFYNGGVGLNANVSQGFSFDYVLNARFTLKRDICQQNDTPLVAILEQNLIC
jgi:hypothetical protein